MISFVVHTAWNKTSGVRLLSPLAIAAVLLFCIVRPAKGQVVWNGQAMLGSGPGGATPDATGMGEDAGNPNAGIFTSDIALNGPGTVGSLDFIRLQNFSHTYAGDLVFQLTHLDTGTSVLFLDRPDKTSNNIGFGSSSDLQGNFTFVSDLPSVYGASDSIWSALDTSSVVNGGTFAATGNRFLGTPTRSYLPTDLNTFDGESISGTWRLTIRDEASRDTGCFSSWQLQITPASAVPEPGSISLMIAGLLVTRGLRSKARL